MEYELIRSARKTISLRLLLDGTPQVRAPLRMPKREIDAFVEKEAEWIKKHRGKQRERLENAENVELDDARVRELAQLARERLPELVEKWARAMGVSPTGITITAAATRWGSCSAKGRLSFSVRTLLLPEECVEYVVVHELAHLKEHNHGEGFYREVARVLPDWKSRVEKVKAYERAHVIRDIRA